MEHLIILPVLLPLFTGVALLLLARGSRSLRRWVSVLAATVLVPITLALLLQGLEGPARVYALGGWSPPFGIVLVLDGLAGVMLALTAVLALPALLYACRGDDARGPNFHALFQFQLMGLNGAFLTGDIFNLFVFFEVLLIASYGLLLHGGGSRRTRAGLHYVVLNLVGSSLFLLALGLLYGTAGTLNMADLALAVREASGDEAVLLRAAALVLLVVFGLKAALLPLYFWLPAAYSAASAPVAALFAVMTKVGVYAILRVYSLIFGAQAGELAHVAIPWLWPVALATLLLGGLGALTALRLSATVAWLVIMSVGTLLAGVSLATAAATAAVIYYLVHSTLAVAALFLIADLVAHGRGDKGDRLTAGSPPHHRMMVGGLYLLGAMALVGLPPLSGFVGKVALMQAAPPAAGGGAFWVLLLLGGFFALIALSRAGSTLFWRPQHQPSNEPMDPLRLGVTLILPALMVALSAWADTVLRAGERVAAQLHAPDRYIEAVLGSAEGRTK